MIRLWRRLRRVRCSTCHGTLNSQPCSIGPNGGTHTIYGGCSAAEPTP